MSWFKKMFGKSGRDKSNRPSEGSGTDALDASAIENTFDEVEATEHLRAAKGETMTVGGNHEVAINMQILHFYNRTATSAEIERIVAEIIFTEKNRNIRILETLPSKPTMSDMMCAGTNTFLSFVRTMLIARHINKICQLKDEEKSMAIGVAEKMANDLWDPLYSDGIANLVEESLNQYWPRNQE